MSEINVVFFCGYFLLTLTCRTSKYSMLTQVNRTAGVLKMLIEAPPINLR